MNIFTGKTLMITGGTGSFGNAVLNRFLKTDIAEIRIFSRDEKKQDDMRHEYQAKMPEVAHKIKFFIGDVRNLQSCKNAMPGVDYIFHAAALKQVPSCEFFPMEAVKTNVIGTDNVLTAAIEAGVKAVICLSTDKAAYPINAMGITKAIVSCKRCIPICILLLAILVVLLAGSSLRYAVAKPVVQISCRVHIRSKVMIVIGRQSYIQPFRQQIALTIFQRRNQRVSMTMLFTKHNVLINAGLYFFI